MSNKIVNLIKRFKMSKKNKKLEKDLNEEIKENNIDNIEENDKKDEEESEDRPEELGEKLLELNDKYLRLYSDFENYRKRTSKEKVEIIRYASEEVVKDLLTVIDDYERALEDINAQDLPETTKEGLNLVYTKLMNTLEKKGVKPIEAIGEKFDENIHEAITNMPAEKEEDKGIIIDEITKGYYLYDKVIRYSKVVVAI